ncbi:globin [Euzebya tangerina]|uniref:globin n=1 Tax=Euzebya tangerina TaxID=591198 RepID=UPI0023E7AD4E|nr:globin [Euzebya tangerina]
MEPDRSLPQAASVPRTAPDPPTQTLFDRVGGEAFFVRLVDAFYQRVEASEILRPLYPDPELSGANERLRLFLIQYWGGPTTYSDTRGHPRLRMRHAPFPVYSTTIAAWLDAMSGALDEVDPEPDIREELWAYFERAATFMRNMDG